MRITLWHQRRFYYFFCGGEDFLIKIRNIKGGGDYPWKCCGAKQGAKEMQA